MPSDSYRRFGEHITHLRIGTSYVFFGRVKIGPKECQLFKEGCVYYLPLMSSGVYVYQLLQQQATPFFYTVYLSVSYHSHNEKVIISLFGIPNSLFLGAVEKLLKATISLVMSVRVSLHMEQLGSHWNDFHEV